MTNDFASPPTAPQPKQLPLTVWRRISRGFGRAYVRFGHLSWWRLLLGLAFIFAALIAFISYPTFRAHLANVKAGPERDAIKRVVKNTVVVEVKKFGGNELIVIDRSDAKDEPAPEPTASSQPSESTSPPQPPEPPKSPAAKSPSSPKAPTSPTTTITSKIITDATVRIDEDGVHIESEDGRVVNVGKDGVIIEKAATQEDAVAARAEAKANQRAAEHEKEKATSGDTFSISMWGETIKFNEADSRLRSVPREPLLSEEKQAAIERSVRFDVHKALYGTVGLTAMTFLSLLLLITRAFAGRAVRQTQRVKVVEAAAKVDSSARQIAEAQLKAMQAQVEPHFLFNTLAHVKALQEVDVKQAGDMLDNLITYLRTAIPNLREGSSTLGKEFELAHAYLNILKLRMGDRLSFSLDIPESLKTQAFPPALVINLVENAIKHGLERARGGGSVRLSAQRVGEMITVSVADTGRGLDPTAPGGTGVGLSSIRERLRLLYGDSAKLTLEPNSPSGVIATLALAAVAPTMTASEASARNATTQTSGLASDPNVSDCTVHTGILLAALGGIGGAHNWYLGRRKTAVVQSAIGLGALTSAIDGSPTVPLFIIIGIWLIADIIMIATKSMKDGQGRYVLRDR